LSDQIFPAVIQGGYIHKFPEVLAKLREGYTLSPNIPPDFAAKIQKLALLGSNTPRIEDPSQTEIRENLDELESVAVHPELLEHVKYKFGQKYTDIPLTDITPKSFFEGMYNGGKEF
jgi:hypothetical protein